MAFRKISITDISGFKLGNSENASAGTGCTVIICDKGALGGVSCRGGAPSTRETDILRSEKIADLVNAVIISGGSTFGIEASCGAVRELAAHGIGAEYFGKSIPIVCGACIYDLNVGSDTAFPNIEMGASAVKNALEGYEFMVGNHGVGTGASVGKIIDFNHCMKSGLGSFACMDDELQVGAISVVNAAGDVFDGANNMVAGTLNDDGYTLDGCIKALKDRVCTEQAEASHASCNTTVSCLLTNAKLSKAECNMLADILNDAYARAIKPVHTTIDGDTIFVLTTNEVPVNFDAYAALATDIMQYSLIDSVLSAESAYGLLASKDVVK